MTEKAEIKEPEAWHVLVVGLPLDEDKYDLGESLTIHKLIKPLSVFDLAAVGSVGFREWAVLEPLAHEATAEIISPTSAVNPSGYDSLNKCWLASALLLIRGFARHICPAVSAYSWNLIAGYQKNHSKIFKQQVAEEGIDRAVYNPHESLPPFKGGLLDYHLTLLLPPEVRNEPFNVSEAFWIASHFKKFNTLSAKDERFRFSLEAAIDWRYAKDPRAAISRIWSGIESIFGIKSELTYRIALLISSILFERGPARIDAFQKVKRLYDLRSKAVHGAAVTEEVLFTGVFDSYEILRRLLLDSIDRGNLRSEEEYLQELLA